MSPFRPRRRPSPRARAADASLWTRIEAAGGSRHPSMPARSWTAWRNRALRSRAEVDSAVATVRAAGLAPHHDLPKNWDYLVALGSILDATSPRARVLEMGAARYSPLLTWLFQYGYRRLHGIDLTYDKPLRRGPIRLEHMDLTATAFPDASFDAVACLSVIEHGVDTDAYLREARRLLRPGGVLVTSTDYWCDPMDTAGHEAYGQPVRIFDRSAIEAVVARATALGLRLDGGVDLACGERVVHWERTGLDYTFVVLVHHAPPAGPVARFRTRLARAARRVRA